MLTFKLKRVKIGTVITSIDRALPIAINTQYESLATMSPIAANIMVSGVETLPSADGLELVKTGLQPTIKNALATYIQRFRGNEGVVLTNPEVFISRDLDKLINHVEAEKLGLTWACHANVGPTPRFFAMSSQTVQHVWNDIDDKMTFANDWQAWLHMWMERLLRQRYFDATPLGIIEPVPSSSKVVPVVQPVVVKKSVVRKVKHS